MNVEGHLEASDDATITQEIISNEMRREIKGTFKSFEEVLSQTGSVEDIIITPKFTKLVANAKDCLHELDEKKILRNDDFRFEIAKAIEAIECYQSEIRQGHDGDEWLKTARERIRGVNDRLKGW